MNTKLPIPCVASLQPDASVRDKILTAANEILLTLGFSALTQQSVAGRAGVRQSHLTYYFPTRNDLLRGTAQFGVEVMFRSVTEPSVSGELSVEDLRQ
ncbi:MAG: TetR/AcrR family transcriptional regulator, partial [Casimicrobium sp.]